jgi:hypothetical protein
VDAPGNDGNASMPEQFRRNKPWRKMMMMIMIMILSDKYYIIVLSLSPYVVKLHLSFHVTYLRALLLEMRAWGSVVVKALRY